MAIENSPPIFNNLPDSLSMLSNETQNYPNPFNPATTIKYGLPFDAKVTLKIFDILGCEIVTLINKAKKTGTYRIEFNSRDISSGVYFYTISVHSVDGKFFTKLRSLFQ